MKKLYLILAVGIILAVAGCNLPFSGGAGLATPTPGNTPRSWIDAPLEGMILTPGSYEVIFHGASLLGVEKGELLVNDAPAATLANDQPGATLVVFKTNWTPPGAGKFVLRARALDKAGKWSEYSSVTVSVGGTPSFTPSSTWTATPTFTPTRATISATVTRTRTPTLTPALSFAPQVSPDTFYTGGCTPDRADISVRVSSNRAYASLFLFFKLQDQNGSSGTNWAEPVVMSKLAEGSYSYTLLASKIPGAGTYGSAYLLVQFVLVDNGGGVVARSQVFAAASLAKCGVRIPPLGTLGPGVIHLPTIATTAPGRIK